MTYLSAAVTVGYVILYPLVVVLSWVLACLSPVIHLVHYLLHALFFPLRLLARFETLYIYLGVAAVLGILAGTCLHFSHRMLISVLDLHSRPDDKPAFASLTRRSKSRGVNYSPDSLGSPDSSRPRIDVSLKREYADWLDKDRARKREGLVSQTILEEEDDSEDDF